MRNKNTLDNFIEKARKVHGDKYDYSKVKYVNNKKNYFIDREELMITILPS